jgi:multiple sugar transport system substrate-binding protein
VRHPLRSHRRRSWSGALAAVAAATVALTACSGGNSSSSSEPAHDGPVHIKVWAWYPEFKGVVDLFNKTHKDVQIDWTNAGAGGDEYTKLQTALKAGKGAPDVAMLEFQELPTINLTKHLVDMGQYGANDIKGDFVDWAWQQVSDGDKVYAIPVDAGPMGLLYRQDIFDKYHLAVPKTWDEFKTEAQKLKAASPGSFITDFGANDGGFMTGIMQQAGSSPYTYSASNLPNITVKLNNDGAKKAMTYWQDMVTSGLADTKPYGTTDFYNGLTTGRYATYIAAGWGPGYLSSVAKSTAGKWRAAPLPQWDAGGTAQADWGGSSFAVTDQTKFPKEATLVAKEIFGSNQDAWKIGIDKAFLFPTAKPILDWDYFQNKQFDFFGNQKIMQVFVPAANGVSKFDWNPFNDYAFSQLTTAMGQAVTKKTSWADALDSWQKNVTDYASKQGFKVSS